MNIIQTGTNFKIFGGDIETHDKLPKGTYGIEFSKMSGYSLYKIDDLKIKEKVYGNLNKRVNKILNTFKNVDRNLGVILYGKKGSGKSMTAKLLAEKSDYPVILVDESTPSLADFLMSIKQEVIILFDEFEKHFGDNNSDEDNDNGSSSQSDLLSLFDGVDGGKKLFVITCNEKGSLNRYYLNRPGRFHYLFTYDVPTHEEIKEYLEDNLDDKNKVDSVLKYSNILDFTFDSLRAVCTDVNLGYSVDETIIDLNIDTEIHDYNVKAVFENNEIITCGSIYCEPFSEDRERVYIESSSGDEVSAVFNCEDMIVKDDKLIIPGADLDIRKTGSCDDIPEILRLEFYAKDDNYSSNITHIISSMI